MTQRLDIAEFLAAYLAEVDEQISTANAQILAVEASLAGDRGNPRAIREVFRALHTIKGLSAMVGVGPVEAIAHRMETALRGADRAGTLTEATLETLIDGLRAIELRIRALREGKPVAEPPRQLLEALDLLEPEAVRDAAEAAGPVLDIADDATLRGRLASFELEQLTRALNEGRRALRLEFVPSVERAAAGLTINGVRERLAALAEIVKVVPVPMPATAGAPAGLAFVLLLVTSASDEALAGASGLDVSAVTPICLKTTPSAPQAAIVAPEGPPEPALPEYEPDRRSVLRVDVGRVDDAMEKVASLIVSRSRLIRAVATLSAASVDTRELQWIAAQFTRQLRDLRTSILHVRMVRVSEILERIPLVVRGLRRTTGKLVRLEMDTGEAELDKAVAERIFPAILHIVRNAVDHGIEPPNARRAAGKPEEGVVRITTSSRSNTQLELTVSDDGGGIDRARVAARASAPVPASDAGLLELLCRPGLSTRDTVTTTSGRGVGMDIVKRAIAELGGEIVMTTQRGSGTTFALHVPLTIAIVDAFTIRCGRERFVVPVSVIEEIVDVDAVRVVSAPVTLGGGAAQMGMFERRGEAVPLVDLASALRIPHEGFVARRGMVLRRGGQPVAFVFDEVLGQQEAVVRPLADPLVDVAGVSGTTDLGDGHPVLVLDLASLAEARPAALLPQAPRIPALTSGPAEGRQTP